MSLGVYKCEPWVDSLVCRCSSHLAATSSYPPYRSARLSRRHAWFVVHYSSAIACIDALHREERICPDPFQGFHYVPEANALCYRVFPSFCLEFVAYPSIHYSLILNAMYHTSYVATRSRLAAAS